MSAQSLQDIWYAAGTLRLASECSVDLAGGACAFSDHALDGPLIQAITVADIHGKNGA